MNETKIEKIKEMIIQDNLFNIEPGPGYYDIINSNSIYSKNKYKSNISSFGSKEKRETLKLKNEESPGPGLYYNMTKPKKKPIKKKT